MEHHWELHVSGHYNVRPPSTFLTRIRTHSLTFRLVYIPYHMHINYTANYTKAKKHTHVSLNWYEYIAQYNISYLYLCIYMFSYTHVQ